MSSSGHSFPPPADGSVNQMDVLRRQADRNGLLPFVDYMESVLYGPHGYYQRQVKLGGQGADFYTAAQFPLFGMTIGRYIRQLVKENSSATEIRIVELGPGQGELAFHVCSYLLDDKTLTMPIAYSFVERSDRLRAIQAEKVAPLAQEIMFTWLDASVPSPKFRHVFVLSNELLDALPVERIRRDEHGFQRGYVQVSEADVREVFLPADVQLCNLAERYTPVPLGHTAELCLRYDDIFQYSTDLADQVDGLFFDYGIYAEEWRQGIRPNGTLRAFSQHRLVHPLEVPGEVDITADVNWDLARDTAQHHGFDVTEVQKQGSFLMKQGVMEVAGQLSSMTDSREPTPTERAGDTGSTTQHLPVRTETQVARAIKQLVFPGGMGERFSAFVFKKHPGGERPC